MLPRRALSRVTLVGLLAVVSLYATQHSTATSTVARTASMQPGSPAAPRLAPYRPLTTSPETEFRGTAAGARWVEGARRTGPLLAPVRTRSLDASGGWGPATHTPTPFRPLARSGA